jgi:hypothetical protein
MSFGNGHDGGGWHSGSLNPGIIGNRDSYNVRPDQISDQAEHTAELERDEAAGRRRLPARLARRLMRTLRNQI